MKCEVNWALNSLKVLMEFGVNLLNQILTGPFSVIGKALHMISSSTPWRCIRVWRFLGDRGGPWPRRSFQFVACEISVEEERNWQR